MLHMNFGKFDCWLFYSRQHLQHAQHLRRALLHHYQEQPQGQGGLFWLHFPCVCPLRLPQHPKVFLVQDQGLQRVGKLCVKTEKNAPYSLQCRVPTLEPLDLRKSFDHVYVIISNVIVTGKIICNVTVTGKIISNEIVTGKFRLCQNT